VECSQVGASDVVEVTYDMGSDPNLPRAFGLDVSVDNGATIGTIYDFDPNFYVSPGSFDYNESTGDANWGNPVVNLASSSFTVEMGSLYAAGDPCGHTSPPESSGTLLRFTVSGDCNVVLEENAARAGTDSNGVVMEDTEKSFPASYVTLSSCQIDPECYWGQSDYDEWEDVNKPDSWCNPRQCHGDADGIYNQYGPPFNPQWAWVSTEDVAILIKGYRQPYSGDPAVDGGDPDSDPDTWISADFDHTNNQFGPPFNPQWARISTEDVAVLIEYYRESVDPNCLD
jgi:hypothetical protein